MRSSGKRTEAAIKLTASVLLLTFTVIFSKNISVAALNMMKEFFVFASVYFPEEESEKVTEKDSNETPAVTASEMQSVKYETPKDILDMQKEYENTYSEKDISGKVLEYYYLTKGATDIFGDVAVKNTTSSLHPEFEKLAEQKSDLEIADMSEPTVLIFHTHTTESYLMNDNGVFYKGYSTKSDDPARNMVRVGDEICKALEKNGIGYIHDTEIYDGLYNGAYARSRVSVEKYLSEYPSIKIVLDVHRDALYYSDTSHGKTAYEIDGKKAAQIMIISGAQDGSITDFPDWEYNLRFALEIQKNAMEKYYGLMRPVFFCPRRYNMDTAHCSLLLEFGTDANTLDEAVYSGYLFGNVLSDLIKDHCI